jgi:hypothetical protein
MGGSDGQRFVPYNGRTADGRRTWYSESQLRFDIGAETYYVDGGMLVAAVLHRLGITDGDPCDWLQHKEVREWVMLNGIRKDPSLNP